MSEPLPLQLTETAEADLAEIWAYLASEATEEVATRFISEIEAAFEPVRHFPLASPAREMLGAGLRVTFHGAYAIYFQPRPDAVIIVRVLHGARDVAALAERGGIENA